jgi:uncharacterized protein YaeQ
MALKATIFKADIEIADLDRNYYATHTLTLARHPSETDERMMVRLLAFALHAHESLQFAKGLSDTDEPDLWQKDATGAITLWLEVGQPDERRLLKACGRASQVAVYAYGSGPERWWEQSARGLERADRLTVWRLPQSATQELARLAQRGMRLQCTIQEGQVWFTDGEQAVRVEPELLKAFGGPRFP